MIIAGTGSRSLQIASVEKKKVAYGFLVEQFTALIEKYGRDDLVIMSGMAEGFDALMARIAIDLNIYLIAAIPNKGYLNYYWARNSVTGENRSRVASEYLDYAKNTGGVVYVMEDVHKSSDIYLYRDGRRIHSNFIRNEYMVEQADAFYVYAPKSSGTKHCLELIQKSGKPYKLVPTE